MTKKEKIQYLKQGHEKLKNLINKLNKIQLTETKVLDNWTIKDILVHLAAWNIEYIKRINEVLILGKIPEWWNSPEKEDEFNNKAIEERKNKDIEEILIEWENSFNNCIKRVEEISDEQWDNYKPIALKKFFIYEYHGLDHEGGHAKQIEDFLINHLI